MRSLALYFAYGSNMLSSRMKKRVKSAEDLGIALLFNYQVQCNKDGLDGGKANLVEAPGWTTWGVLYQFEESAFEELDKKEKGYDRVHVTVHHGDEKIRAFTYISEQYTNRKPTRDYIQFILDGAREHKLPPNYIEYLEGFLYFKRK